MNSKAHAFIDGPPPPYAYVPVDPFRPSVAFSLKNLFPSRFRTPASNDFEQAGYPAHPPAPERVQSPQYAVPTLPINKPDHPGEIVTEADDVARQGARSEETPLRGLSEISSQLYDGRSTQITQQDQDSHLSLQRASPSELKDDSPAFLVEGKVGADDEACSNEEGKGGTTPPLDLKRLFIEDIAHYGYAPTFRFAVDEEVEHVSASDFSQYGVLTDTSAQPMTLPSTSPSVPTPGEELPIHSDNAQLLPQSCRSLVERPTPAVPTIFQGVDERKTGDSDAEPTKTRQESRRLLLERLVESVQPPFQELQASDPDSVSPPKRRRRRSHRSSTAPDPSQSRSPSPSEILQFSLSSHHSDDATVLPPTLAEDDEQQGPASRYRLDRDRGARKVTFQDPELKQGPLDTSGSSTLLENDYMAKISWDLQPPSHPMSSPTYVPLPVPPVNENVHDQTDNLHPNPFDVQPTTATASTKLYILAFLFDTVPRQIYLHLLLRLPYLYFSRVTRIFEEAEMSMPMIKQSILDAAREKAELGHSLRAEMTSGEKRRDLEEGTANRSKLPLEYWETPLDGAAYRNLQDTWQTFVDSLQKEWKTLNIISVLLLSAILTILQIPSAAADPVTRYSALLSMICALMSLLYGCVYIIRFGTMRKTYKGAAWAEEAQKTRTSIFWNVWVLLAMPATWLAWSMILYIATVMSFVWRTTPFSQPNTASESPAQILIPRLVISFVLALGVLYFFLIAVTLRQYGDLMDRAWQRRIWGWMRDELPEASRVRDVETGEAYDDKKAPRKKISRKTGRSMRDQFVATASSQQLNEGPQDLARNSDSQSIPEYVTSVPFLDTSLMRPDELQESVREDSAVDMGGFGSAQISTLRTVFLSHSDLERENAEESPSVSHWNIQLPPPGQIGESSQPHDLTPKPVTSARLFTLSPSDLPGIPTAMASWAKTLGLVAVDPEGWAFFQEAISSTLSELPPKPLLESYAALIPTVDVINAHLRSCGIDGEVFMCEEVDDMRSTFAVYYVVCHDRWRDVPSSSDGLERIREDCIFAANIKELNVLINTEDPRLRHVARAGHETLQKELKLTGHPEDG